MIQLYSKLIEDLTWKKDFSETYQIVALTTLVHEMQGTLKSNTISLTTKDEEQATAYPKKDLTQSMRGYLWRKKTQSQLMKIPVLGAPNTTTVK